MKVENISGVGYERHNQRNFTKHKRQPKRDEYTPSLSESSPKIEITPHQLFLIDGFYFSEEEIEIIRNSL